MTLLYKYSDKNGVKIGNMSDQEIIDVMLRVEKAERTGGFQYAADEVPASQIEEMKAWPDEVKNFARDVAKEVKAKHPEFSKTRLQREAMAGTLKMIAAKRASGKGSLALAAEIKTAAADVALSALFKKAPDVSDSYKPRKMMAGKEHTFLVKPSDKMVKLVVNCDQIDQADVYVLSLYNEQLNRAWLLGYATKNDLKAAKKGNRTTSPEECLWSKMSYYMLPSELKPMSAMIKTLGLTDIPEGVLFEKMPSHESIPLPSRASVSTLTDAPAVKDDVDMDELLGLKPSKKPAEAKPEQKPETKVVVPETEKPKAEAKPEPAATPSPKAEAPKEDFAF
jgi:hypothetical protein